MASATFFDINSLPHINETIPIYICSDNAIDFLARRVSICKSAACDDSHKGCDTRMNCNYYCVSVSKNIILQPMLCPNLELA